MAIYLRQSWEKFGHVGNKQFSNTELCCMGTSSPPLLGMPQILSVSCISLSQLPSLPFLLKWKAKEGWVRLCQCKCELLVGTGPGGIASSRTVPEFMQSTEVLKKCIFSVCPNFTTPYLRHMVINPVFHTSKKTYHVGFQEAEGFQDRFKYSQDNP